MKECPCCGNKLKKEEKFCDKCFTDKKSKKESVFEGISHIHNIIVILFYPVVCLTMIKDNSAFKTTIKNGDYVWFIFMLLAIGNAIYNGFFKYKHFDNLRSEYRFLKSKERKK